MSLEEKIAALMPKIILCRWIFVVGEGKRKKKKHSALSMQGLLHLMAACEFTISCLFAILLVLFPPSDESRFGDKRLLNDIREL